MVTIRPIPIFDDNYVWLIIQQQSCYIVDPGDATPVIQTIENDRLKPLGILITHGHWDHISGIEDLVDRYDIPVWGPENDRIPALTQSLNAQSSFALWQEPVSIIETPGHTWDHISYYLPTQQALFCGDVIFSAGCGRVNDSMSKAYESIRKLATLPEETQVYCTHEYTLANIRFARAAEPDNATLLSYQMLCEKKRQRGEPTLPTSIQVELDINPFVRASNESNFIQLRDWKNRF